MLRTICKIGGKAVQRRMGRSDGEARRHWEHYCRCRRGVPGTWPCRRRPPKWCAKNIEVPPKVCPAYAVQVSLSDETSNLDGIEGALKQCAETSTIKRVLLRADMLQRVRKYDAKLSNVLQTFQVRLDLSLIRFVALKTHSCRPSSL